MDIKLTFWQIFGLQIGLGAAVAFAMGWRTHETRLAYKRGMMGSYLVVFLPGCVPMCQSDPIAANRAADSFFWTMLPALPAWLFSAVMALALSRMIKWKE